MGGCNFLDEANTGAGGIFLLNFDLVRLGGGILGWVSTGGVSEREGFIASCFGELQLNFNIDGGRGLGESGGGFGFTMSSAITVVN